MAQVDGTELRSVPGGLYAAIESPYKESLRDVIELQVDVVNRIRTEAALVGHKAVCHALTGLLDNRAAGRPATAEERRDRAAPLLRFDTTFQNHCKAAVSDARNGAVLLNPHADTTTPLLNVDTTGELVVQQYRQIQTLVGHTRVQRHGWMHAVSLSELVA